MKIYKLLLSVCLLGCAGIAAASDNKGCDNDVCDASPVPATLKTNALMIGAGATNILDTYLSPEKYRGLDLRLLSHTRREKDSTQWINQFQHEGNIAYADNRSGNGGEMAGGYTFRYSLLRKWHTTLWRHPLQLLAGGTAAANAGFVYNTRNGNNPANARLSLHIEPTVGLDYPIGHARRIGGLSFSPYNSDRYPAVLHYEVSVPLIGLMFSPNYGQSYYEIFSRGNYDHNCVPTTTGSTPSLRQMLTIDFRLARTTWRVGYLGTIEQSRVNGLKTHTYTHSLMIGIVKRFRTIKQ